MHIYIYIHIHAHYCLLCLVVSLWFKKKYFEV